MTSFALQQLGIGSKGFDTAQKLDLATCKAFKAAGYSFVYRYIWRVTPGHFDLSADEIETILSSGLALGLVQHYPGDGWTPSGPTGAQWGACALAACESFGLPDLTVFMDLEGVANGITADVVDQHARAWAYAFKASGRNHAGLYVGDRCVLGPRGLHALPSDCYWRAFNLDADRTPAIRGFAMEQHAAQPIDVPPGVSMTTADFDVNTVSGDSLGGSPRVLVGPGVTTVSP
jgi:hypothetical protein